MNISDVRHEKLDCLFIGKAGLDISLYVDGIICNHILARCSTVIDYARDRIMFVHESLGEESPPGKQSPPASGWTSFSQS